MDSKQLETARNLASVKVDLAYAANRAAGTDETYAAYRAASAAFWEAEAAYRASKLSQ